MENSPKQPLPLSQQAANVAATQAQYNVSIISHLIGKVPAFASSDYSAYYRLLLQNICSERETLI